MHVLVTNRLTLRSPLEVDADAIALHLSDERVACKLAGVPHPYTLDDAHAWIAGEVEDHSAGCTFTIHSNALVGAVSVRPAAGDHELGYWLAPRCWGQGIMSEAARAVLAHSFRELGLERIAARAFVDNTASLRVLEKLGFKMTGQQTATSAARDMPCEALQMALTRQGFESRFGALESQYAA